MRTAIARDIDESKPISPFFGEAVCDQDLGGCGRGFDVTCLHGLERLGISIDDAHPCAACGRQAVVLILKGAG